MPAKRSVLREPGEERDTDAGADGTLLERLRAATLLGDIDYHFARCLARLDPVSSEWVAIAGALASRAVQAGAVCVDLAQLAEAPLATQEGEPIVVQWPSLAGWQAELERSALVQVRPRGETQPQIAPNVALVLSGQRVYLQRYARYQAELAAGLRARATLRPAFDEAALAAALTRYFPEASGELDLQRLAGILAVRGGLCVISGGPGTGKTTTVAKILLILQEQAARSGVPLRLALLAPTGKAAQRLSDSLSAGLEHLGVPASVREGVATEASTIHRALGTSSRTPTRFSRGRSRPLAADVVVVDEASMVDLALMAKLEQAMAPGARLILLGDKDQLASVEAGAIFGDIFNADADHAYSEELCALAARLGCAGLPQAADPGEVRAQRAQSNAEGRGAAANIADCTLHLEKNYRYGSGNAIAELTSAIRVGDFAAARHALCAGAQAAWHVPTADERAVLGGLSALIVEGYRRYCEAESAEQRLQGLSQFRVLTPHRRGALGAEGLNALAEHALSEAGLLTPAAEFYPGRPILITENDYASQLFNGDVGVVGRGDGGRLVAWFAGASGARAIPVSRLPAHETVFAMTVHKSQGSEFSHVAVVLPERASAVLGRELIYTAVSRARERVDLFAAEDVLRQALERKVRRASGLRDELWGSAS